MKILFFTFLLLLSFNANAARYQEETVGEAFTYTQLKLLPGYGYASILNQDGTKAVFAGPHGGAEFDVVFSFQDINLAVGPFVHAHYGQYKNLNTSSGQSQELKKSDLMYGVKAFIKPFYVGFAYGENTSWFNNNFGAENKLGASIIGFTGGLRLFSITKTWHVGLSGWYKSAFFTKARNPGLSDNTQMETLEMSITIDLSPLFQIL